MCILIISVYLLRDLNCPSQKQQCEVASRKSSNSFSFIETKIINRTPQIRLINSFWSMLKQRFYVLVLLFVF